MSTKAGEVQLGAQGPLPEGATQRLLEQLTSTDDAYLATRLADLLGAQGPLPEAATQRLLKLARQGNQNAYNVLWSLAGE
ncbi:MAG: hypothetical protein LC777_08620 [Actinobacteria bacterium]|nr:hypothetical protein [Actinomycetota bacterium]